MSSRYVWKKYNTKYAESIGEVDHYVHVIGQSEDLTDTSETMTCTWYEASSITISANGTITLNNPVKKSATAEYGFGSQDIEIAEGTYISCNQGVYYAGESTLISVACGHYGNGYFKLTIGVYDGRPVSVERVKNTLVGSISASATNTYPTDGTSGSYWYVYQGSDSIDPTAVSYPASPKSGTPIDIDVTPCANTYGGTISYQYEVSLDGGSTWEQLSLTTAISQSYTIPKGTETFRARVQARDNLGFTSADWVYGTQYSVVNNAAPTAPGSITVPVSPRGGGETTVSWTASTDVDGNLSGYALERQLNGGTWAQVYEGSALYYVDAIPKGTLTAAYRVRAYDADSAYSDYTTSATRTVVNNEPPVITSTLSGDLGTKSEGFTVPYIVTDAESGVVTVTEAVGDLVKRSYEVELGQEQTFHVEDQGDYFFMRILNGPQTVKITATDEAGMSSTLELPFTKAVHSMSVTLAEPLEVEDAISVAIMSVLGNIPEDAAFKVLVTNNAKDAAPAWQDATAAIKAGLNIAFSNTVQTNGPAFNFKLTASRGESGEGGYVKMLKGAFQ